MFNWSTDETYFKENAPLEYQQWRVLQLINYGLDGEKLDEQLVRQMWPKIKERDFYDIYWYIKKGIEPNWAVVKSEVGIKNKEDFKRKVNCRMTSKSYGQDDRGGRKNLKVILAKIKFMW